MCPPVKGTIPTLFKTINRVDPCVDPYKFLVRQLADRIIPVAVILTKVRI